MKLLNELLMLSESKEKNLIGIEIGHNHEFVDGENMYEWHDEFFCNEMDLTSLKGCPSIIHGMFNCEDNELTSLKYGPKIIDDLFNCAGNKLTSLEHCPKEVGCDFVCSSNNITSLKDIHKQLHKMKGVFDANDNPITSHVLGVLLIEGCRRIEIDNKEVEAIINSYLPNKEGRKGLMKCKAELVDAGYEAFAQI